MAGASGYGEQKQTGGGYGASQNPASLYAANSKPSKNAPVPAAPPAPPSAEKVAAQMTASFTKMYLDEYCGGKIDKRTRIGMKIPVQLVTDQGMEAALVKQVVDVVDSVLRGRLRFCPQWVVKKLKEYYASIKQPWPYDGRKFGAGSKLTPEEQNYINGDLKADLIADLRSDVAATQGIYSRPADGKGTGTIFARREDAVVGMQHNLAGTLAHELAHAFAHPNWWTFLDAMEANSASRTGELAEGMAVYFERLFVYKWLDDHSDQMIPLEGYRDQPLVKKTGKEFIDSVGPKNAIEAYFWGAVTITDLDNAANTIIVGSQPWVWPW